MLAIFHSVTLRLCTSGWSGLIRRGHVWDYRLEWSSWVCLEDLHGSVSWTSNLILSHFVLSVAIHRVLVHPFVVLRRQCQVNAWSRKSHIHPFSLLPIMYKLANKHVRNETEQMISVNPVYLICTNQQSTKPEVDQLVWSINCLHILVHNAFICRNWKASTKESTVSWFWILPRLSAKEWYQPTLYSPGIWRIKSGRNQSINLWVFSLAVTLCITKNSPTS